MSEGEKGWFHCGRCGALFQAATGGDEPGVCSECGRVAAVEDSEVAFLRASNPSSQGTRRKSGGSPSEPKEVEHSSGRSWVMTLVVGWVAVLLVISVVALYVKRNGEDDAVQVIDEDQRLLSDHLGTCYGELMAFVAAATPELRVEHVLKSTTLRRMSRYYQSSPMLVLSDESLDLKERKVLDTPAGKAIETIWSNEEGKLIEAVFFQDGEDVDDWRIDWDAFVRYSEHDWPIFLSGEGSDVGEFRLLARMRARDVGLEGTVEKLVLAAPKVGRPNETGAQSPEIHVDPESRTGRILRAAFRRKEKGSSAYGAKADGFDPTGTIRVRLRLKRIEGEERSFEVQKVIACHWLHFDDLGIDD